ncbi:hypothetical protein MASR1M36_18680 [Candidatus Cloacimonadaceae bacterium]
MFKHSTRVLCLAAGLLFGISLAGLSEVRTTQVNSAIPSTGVNFFFSSAFAGSSVWDDSPSSQSKVVKSVSGGYASLKVDPHWELSVWLSSYQRSTAIELQTKMLVYHEQNTYLSFVPAIYNSAGSKSGGGTLASGYKEECSLNGIALPLILSLDSKRNVTMNLSAGANSEWVSVKGYYGAYNSTTYQYDRVHYTRNTVNTWRGHLNLSLTANSGALIMTPEIGITFADARNQGKMRFLNYGISFGARL